MRLCLIRELTAAKIRPRFPLNPTTCHTCEKISWNLGSRFRRKSPLSRWFFWRNVGFNCMTRHGKWSVNCAVFYCFVFFLKSKRVPNFRRNLIENHSSVISVLTGLSIENCKGDLDSSILFVTGTLECRFDMHIKSQKHVVRSGVFSEVGWCSNLNGPIEIWPYESSGKYEYGVYRVLRTGTNLEAPLWPLSPKLK